MHRRPAVMSAAPTKRGGGKEKPETTDDRRRVSARLTVEQYNRLRAYAALNRMTNEETLIAALEKMLKEAKK